MLTPDEQTPVLLMWGVPGFSGDLSLLEGNTPILINRGSLTRGQHYYETCREFLFGSR